MVPQQGWSCSTKYDFLFFVYSFAVEVCVFYKYVVVSDQDIVTFKNTEV